MHPIITLTCTFTRRWAVERWLEDLAGVQHDPALTNLVFIVDVDEPYIMTRLKRFAEPRGYRSMHFAMNVNNLPNPDTHIQTRRRRIADVKVQSCDFIALCDGDYVIGLEDDTEFSSLESFDRLLQPLIENKEVGFVEGIQCGRHGVKMIGVWEADYTLEPREVKSLLPPPENPGYQDIAAGGFYGYATRKELYLNHEYYSSAAQPWGPDVNFGLYVCNRGFKCLADWQTVFGHNDHNVLHYPDSALTEVVYTKDINTGKWGRYDTDRKA